MRPPVPPSAHPAWTFAITACGLSLFALDRLIVVSALPVIGRDFGAGVSAMAWTVNAFTVAFAVLLLAGAALGDRFGRRRMFTAGLALFTAGSAAAALAPSAGALIAARAVQGVGGSLLVPLSLTLLFAVTPPARRGAVLGVWGGVAGVAAASGPVLGGAITGALSWHWIFWINVPLGLALIPLARRHLVESRGPHDRLDLPGLVLSGAGLLALVWGLLAAGTAGWTSPAVVAAFALAILLLAAFVAWEHRAPAPMLPPGFFRIPVFAVTSAVSLLAYLGLFGALFLLGQLLQSGYGASPLGAGLGLLPLTGAMVVVAPVAGVLSDRVGPRRLLIAALAVETVALGALGLLATPGASYGLLAPALMLAGVGAAALFAPVQATLLGALPPAHHGQASGAATAIREVGGVLGVSIVALVFSAHGDAATREAFLAGVRPGLLIAAVVVAAATLTAATLLQPSRRSFAIRVAARAPASGR